MTANQKLRKIEREIFNVTIFFKLCHCIFDTKQRSIDRAPFPFIKITIRIERSITKYSMPSPFFFPNQFIAHPSDACTMRAPAK